MRTPGYMSEVLYGIFIYWVLKQRKYKVKENQLVFFRETNAAKCKLAPAKTAAAPKKPKKPKKVESILKKIMRSIFPAYRVALRNEERLGALVASVNDLQKKSTEHSVLLARTVKVCQSTAPKSVQAAAAKPPIIATSLRKDIWDAKRSLQILISILPALQMRYTKLIRSHSASSEISIPAEML